MPSWAWTIVVFVAYYIVVITLVITNRNDVSITGHRR